MLRTTPGIQGGNSGSPLLDFGVSQVPRLVGVAHGGRTLKAMKGPDLPEYYAGYTYAASALPWLHARLGFKSGESIYNNYKNLACMVSREWSPNDTRKLLSDFAGTNQNKIFCEGGIPIMDIIANKEKELSLEEHKHHLRKMQREVIKKLAEDGVLRSYDYEEARKAEATHEQAIEAANSAKATLLSIYDYEKARKSGATHEQAMEVATSAKAALLSIYDYEKIRKFGATHETALKKAQQKAK